MRATARIARALAVVGLMAIAAGCGGDDDDSAKRRPAGPHHRAPTPAESRDVRATIAQLEGAIAHRDARVVCRLYSEERRESATEAYATCATAVRSDLRREPPVGLTVGTIDVRVDPRVRPPALEASAAVRSQPRGRDAFDVHARLVPERGAWRLDDDVIDYLVGH